MSFANSRGMSTVDVSDSLLAVHQGGQEHYYASHARPGPDVNQRLVGRFDMTQGLVSCSRYRTLKEPGGGLRMARVRSPGFCGAEHWLKWKDQFDSIMGSQLLEDMPPP